MEDKNQPGNKKPAAVMMGRILLEGNAAINNGTTSENSGKTSRATAESNITSLDRRTLPPPAGMITNQASLLPRAPQPTVQLLQLLNRQSVHPSGSLLTGLPSETQALPPSLQQASPLRQLEPVLFTKQAAGLSRSVSRVPTVQALAATQSNQALCWPPVQPTLALPNSLLGQQPSAAQSLTPDGQSQLLGRLLDPNSNAQVRSQLRQCLIQEIAEVNQLEELVSRQQVGLAAQAGQLLLSQTPSAHPVAAQDQSQLLQRLIRENLIKDKIIARVMGNQRTTPTYCPAGASVPAVATPPARPPLSQLSLPQTSLQGACSVSSGSISSSGPMRPGETTPRPESDPLALGLPYSLDLTVAEGGEIGRWLLAAPGSPIADHAFATDPGRHLLRSPPHEDHGSKLAPSRRTSSSPKKQASLNQQRVTRARQEFDYHPPAPRAKRQKQQKSRGERSTTDHRPNAVRRQYSPAQLSEALDNLAESKRRSAESRRHVLAMRRLFTPEQRHALSLVRDWLQQENERVQRSFSAVGGGGVGAQGQSSRGQ